MADTQKYKVIKKNPQYPDLKGEVELTLADAKKVGLKGYAPPDQEFLELVNATSEGVITEGVTTSPDPLLSKEEQEKADAKKKEEEAKKKEEEKKAAGK